MKATTPVMGAVAAVVMVNAVVVKVMNMGHDNLVENTAASAYHHRKRTTTAHHTHVRGELNGNYR